MRRLSRLLRVARFALVAVVWVPIAGALARLRSHRRIVSDVTGAVSMSRDVAVFAHFDRQGEVRPHVAAYLAALHEAGFSVVFVSNAGRLTDAARAALAPLCARVLVRRNVGYDFGAWRDALERCALTGPDAAVDRLLLANDSVYGPLFPLAPLLARAAQSGTDIVAPTESWQARYHLQSYFLMLSGPVARSAAFAAFWSGVRPAPSKSYVIRHYEIGLTQALLRAGFSAAALFGYAEVLARAALRPPPPPDRDDTDGQADTPAADPAELARGKQRTRILTCAARRIPLNPTSDLWRELLAAGSPFVKRELLRDNPTEVFDVTDLIPELRAAGVDVTLIERDLRRVLRRTAP